VERWNSGPIFRGATLGEQGLLCASSDLTVSFSSWWERAWFEEALFPIAPCVIGWGPPDRTLFNCPPCAGADFHDSDHTQVSCNSEKE
jgi:hypothetical protein